MGAIVRIDPLRAEVRKVDRTIAEIAAAHDGFYDIETHLRHDPAASEAFAETHVRRLEAMRRRGGFVTRAPSGRWRIASDHLEKVAAFEAERIRDRPVRIEILANEPLDRLVTKDAATWIDRDIVTGNILPVRDAGFGSELRAAQQQRRQWLVAQGFAEEASEGALFGKPMLAALQRRELLRVAERLEGELGSSFTEIIDGEEVHGTYRQPCILRAAALLSSSARDFTLVPWRPVLE